MTIILLKPYATYAQGETVSLDNATEASLVGQQRATYTVNPGSAFEPLTAKEQQELRDALPISSGLSFTAAQTTAGATGVPALTAGNALMDAAGLTIFTSKKTAATTGDAVLDIAGTFNGAAQTLRGLKVNITNTASGASSAAFDVQVNGVSIFNISANGQVT